MADQTQRLEIATVKAEVGSNILFRFANDPAANADIPTDSGAIPNLQKVIAGIQEDGAEKISIATTIYQSAAAGLAATADGGIFLVQSSDADEIYTVWKNQAGAAVNTGKTAMSSQAIQDALTASNEAAQAAEDAADVATERTAGLLQPAANGPTVRDNGLPLQVGDRYFNTEEQAEYLYKSGGWASNDSLEAIEDLQQKISVAPIPSGIPQAGEGGKLGDEWLPDSIARASGYVRCLANYNSLRNYSGPATVVRISQTKISGMFNLLTESTLADDNATVIVDASGRVWQREFSMQVNPYWWGAVGDGVTDDSDAFVAATSFANNIGGLSGGVDFLIPSGTFGLKKALRHTSNINVKGTGWIKCLARAVDPTQNNSPTDCLFYPVNGASDVVYENLKIDLNNIPAMNGFMMRTGNPRSRVDGYHIKNGVHDKTTTTPPYTGTQGGRGFNLESNATMLSNSSVKVLNGVVEYCYMGFAVQGGDSINRNGFIIDNLSVENCDVLLWGVGNTTGYPHDGTEMQGIISNITGRNVGGMNAGVNSQYTGQSGAIVFDRCCNVRIKDVAIANSSAYGTIDAVVKGNFAKMDIDVVFIGSASSAISFAPYKESDSVVYYDVDGSGNLIAPIQDNDVSILVHGTVDSFIKNTPTIANLVVRTNLKGSATVITNKIAIPSNFTSFSSLNLDLEDRTDNSVIRGPANVVGSILFSAIPNRTADLTISRTRDLDVRGDLSVSSNVPRLKLTDLSSSSKDFYLQADANALTFLTDSVVDSGSADRQIWNHNDALGVGLFYSGGVAVFGYDSAGIRAGTYSAAPGSTIAGYITVKDMTGTTRKLAVVN